MHILFLVKLLQRGTCSSLESNMKNVIKKAADVFRGYGLSLLDACCRLRGSSARAVPAGVAATSINQFPVF